MDPARLDRLQDLFDAALELPPGRRSAFVDDVCGDDAELRDELRALLHAHGTADLFFSDLAAAVGPPGCEAMLRVADEAGRVRLRAELQAALQDTYRIEEELRGGGMSRVFLAEEIGLGRRVVIKVPASEAAGLSADRFRREIHFAAQLQHPHIVPLLTSGSPDGLLYYTMPFIDGESLAARLDRDGPLPAADVVRIWRDVLDALAFAHGRGVVHHDIKPANILLAGRNALVTDFGVARAMEVATGEAPAGVFGTPAYMAPEQAAPGAASDQRVDLYAAGLVAWEMLEGRLPFRAETAQQLVAARQSPAPPLQRADCPPGLAALIRQCLEPDPALRPASADAVIAVLDDLAIPADAATNGGRHSSRGRGRVAPVSHRTAAVLAAVVVLLVALATLRPRSDASDPSAAVGSATPAVAVLPLEWRGSDDTDATLSYGLTLAYGLTQELMGVLSRTGDLRVAPFNSVEALQERRLELAQVADSLGVSHFLRGSIERNGTRLITRIELVNGRDGTVHWAEVYRHELRDIFEVQDDIARAVGSELAFRLGPGGATAPAPVPRRYTPSVAAYEWYLRGRSLPLLRSEGGLRQGIEYIHRAIAADSSFAAAWAALTFLYNQEAGSAAGNHRYWDHLAERAALRAVQLDDSLPEARSALGWVRMVQRNWTAAEAELIRAVELDPNAHRGYEGLARLYMFTRRPAEQLAAARRGLEVDPYSTHAIREMALALNMNDRCDESLELLLPLKTIDPPARVAGVIRGQCFLRREMWDAAIAEFEWAHPARAALGFLGYAHARAGREADARRILDDLLAGRRTSHDAFGIAVVYAGLRDYDQTFAWLERSVEENSWRPYIMDPLFEDLHRDPRFDRLFGTTPVATR